MILGGVSIPIVEITLLLQVTAAVWLGVLLAKKKRKKR